MEKIKKWYIDWNLFTLLHKTESLQWGSNLSLVLLLTKALNHTHDNALHRQKPFLYTWTNSVSCTFLCLIYNMNKWVIIKKSEWSLVSKVKSVLTEAWENRMSDKDGEQYITGNGKLVFYKMGKMYYKMINTIHVW